MSENERTAKLEVEMSHARSDISEIKSDVKLLLQWRWKLYGMNAAISIIVSGLMLVIFGR